MGTAELPSSPIERARATVAPMAGAIDLRVPALLFVAAFGVRLVLLLLFADPAYPDASYYVDVARQLAAGHGFQVDVVWIFAEVGGTIPPDPTLPIASNAHWMPLASIVQVPFIWALGPTAIASALPFAIAGATAAPLTWALARDAGTTDRVAFGAALLVAAPVLMSPFTVQPDNFSLFQPLVVAALWMTARGLRGHPKAFVLAGLLVGVATLARNDGVLVGATVGLAFVWDRVRAWRSGGSRAPAIPLWAAVACAALFLAAVAPWYARQFAVFGELSPSTASGKVLFIRDISEWNSITTPATLDHLLGQGLGPFLASRVGGLVSAAGIFTTLVLGGLLLPLVVIGAWRRRRSVDFGPFFTYAAILFAFSALVSAVHVPGGTFIHSAFALAPYSYVLALEGVVVAVAWLAARRTRWNRDQAEAVFVGATVAFGLLATVLGTLSVHATWSRERSERQQVAAALDEAGAPETDRLMSIDAAGLRYWTGRGGVVLVNDPIETIEEVARAYDIAWLVVERDDAVPAVTPILDGSGRPDWVGPPILELDASPPAVPGLPAVAVYPVCLEPGDDRCAPRSTAAAPTGPAEPAAEPAR